MVEKGYGIKLELITLKEEELTDAIERMTTDKSYKTNVERISRLFTDRPMSPLENAVWWVEFLLRNPDSSEFIRPYSSTQSWWVRRQLDVWAFVFIVAFFVICIPILILYSIVRLMLKRVLNLADIKQDMEMGIYISNKQNLVLSGIGEDKDEILKEKVEQLLQHNLGQTIYIDTAHRLGAPRDPKKSRLVKIRLRNMSDRKQIMIHKKKLGQVFVNEDLPPGMRSLQYTLRLAVKKAREENRNVNYINWYKGTMEVDGKPFQVTDGKLMPVPQF
ncbi:UDP-glucuronosyltransferase 1-1 [Orchesella cincta]|uniref:UDP-glucuronosyltransferase 1-1 n=1 Tax=Orchesella cincta TaxID=48709 RepID=A0A1D2MAK5_ORCCI|nr:UDP-glucuronosyltransferase 1-1 [Orchesella cincta]